MNPRVISFEEAASFDAWDERSKKGSVGLGDGRPPMRGRYEWENYALGFATFSFFGDFVAPVQDVVRSALIKNQVISPGAFNR